MTPKSLSDVSLEAALAKPNRERSPDEKRLAWEEASRLFHERRPGVPEPDLAEIAKRTGLPLKALLDRASSANWFATRADCNLAQERAALATRQAAVIRVDEVVIKEAERLISKASAQYQHLLDVVGTLPEDPRPRETSEGAPVKSELEIKVSLLARLSQAFMAMAQGAKSLGMIKGPESEDDGHQLLDPAKLAQLNLTVVQRQSEKEMKRADGAIDIHDAAEEGPAKNSSEPAS